MRKLAGILTIVMVLLSGCSNESDYIMNLNQYLETDYDSEASIVSETVQINDEFSIAIAGIEDGNYLDHFDLYLLDSNGNSGIMKNYDSYVTTVYTKDDFKNTMNDLSNMTNYIADKDEYPTENSIEVTGMIDVDMYKQLFEKVDIQGKDVRHTVGKSL